MVLDFHQKIKLDKLDLKISALKASTKVCGAGCMILIEEFFKTVKYK